MAEKALPYALTSLQRVKDLLSITNPNFDVILTREINAVTEYINQECNRNFLMQKYISEVHTQWGVRQKYIPLRQAPVFYQTDIVTTTAGSNQIVVTNPNGIQAGMQVTGDNILSNTFIRSFDYATKTATLTQNALATSTTSHIFIIGLINLMYRAGTPDNPQWTYFTAPQFELVDNGKSGLVRVYGFVSSIYNNTIKADYYAGYLIDWSNDADNLTHTLPSDISRTAENIVIRWYKRREMAGKSEQTLESSTIRYDRLLDQQDLDTIARYRRATILM